MQIWLTRHLSTLVKIPVVILILFAGASTFQALHQYRDASYTADIKKLLELTTATVHEMQKERGMSAGFIGSKGVKFSVKLPRQRKALDSQLEPLLEFLKTANFDSETQSALDNFVVRMNQLDSIRNQVSQQTISVPDTLKYYTANNTLLIELATVVAHHVDDRRSSQQFETLYSIASIKENSGIERAVLSNVFAQGSFNSASFVRFVELRTAQNIYLHTAELLADKEYVETLKKFKSSIESKEVDRYRNTALSETDGFNVDPEVWFSAATKRIGLLREDERILLQQISTHAQELIDSAVNLIALEAAILVFTLYLAYLIHQTLAVSNRQTQEIAKVMNSVVNNRDLSSDVVIISGGELGQIGLKLNEMLRRLREDFDSFQQSAAEVATASNQTSHSTDSTRQGLYVMGEKVSHLAHNGRELSDGVNSDLQEISRAASLAEEVANHAVEGAASVQGAVSGINATSREVQSVGEVIEALNVKVNDIIGMVDIIRSVAEQTNLLALNAAIEAARAGEQGRGFAVVADEVRALAQRTQDSTEDIARTVDELMSRSKEAITTIERGREKSAEAVTMVDSINEVLADTSSKMTDLNQLTAGILESANKQLHQISDITENVSAIDELAAGSIGETEEVATATSQVASQADIMLSNIASYKV